MPSFLPSTYMKALVQVFFVLAFANSITSNGEVHGQCNNSKRALTPRPHSVSILEFGAVGDGVFLNTLAFENAIFYLRSFADKGGAQLYVPKGKWLTGSFNLTSHLTLFLERDAVILGSQNTTQWPIVDPSCSHGIGTDNAGGRYRSLINGYNLTDVVITGENGTIDGQGSIWYERYNSHELNYGPPHLIEIVSSTEVVISNLTLLNSPSWSVHPVHCSKVEVYYLTIQAASDSPYTQGIVPDSCSELCIEECTITTDGNAISLQSNWDDQYAISYTQPSSNIHIRKVYLETAVGSAISFGSTTFGAISNVKIDNLQIRNSKSGIVFKTMKGSKGYISDILISDVHMYRVHAAFEFTVQSDINSDENYDHSDLPLISRVTIKNVIGESIDTAGIFSGIGDEPFSALCLSNITLSVYTNPSWICSNITGFSELVSPQPCDELQSSSSDICYSLLGYNPLAEA